MSLPLLISVPHAGIEVPEMVAPYVTINEEEIIRDGDEQAAEIYLPLEAEATAFVTTNVARVIVDMNREQDDRRADGVVKTQSCWNVPVYDDFPPDEVIERLLNLYYHPYHARLTAMATRNVVLGVDCHTMAALGPPIGPGAGEDRPAACVSNGGGTTCPDEWAQSLAACLEATLGQPVTLNDPFQGGYITRTHAAELPWVQIELSRGPFLNAHQKRNAVWAALAEWCAIHGE